MIFRKLIGGHFVVSAERQGAARRGGEAKFVEECRVYFKIFQMSRTSQKREGTRKAACTHKWCTALT